MKKWALICCCFTAINCNGQLYVKGSAVTNPLVIVGDPKSGGISYAFELRYKAVGIEYMKNWYEFHSDAAAEETRTM